MKTEKIVGECESNLPIRTCNSHRSFHCAKGGVYTYYNRSIMAIANVYTQQGHRRHRMCGVWSPLISDRLQANYLSFFFMKPICLLCIASPYSFVSSQSATPLRFDGDSQNTPTHFSANDKRAFPNLEISSVSEGKKWHFSREIVRVHRIRFSIFLYLRIPLAFISHPIQQIIIRIKISVQHISINILIISTKK